MDNSLTGTEIKQGLEKDFHDLLESLPMLGMGQTYHNCRAEVGVIITAFPPDRPVPPPKEIIILMPKPDNLVAEITAHVEDVAKLQEIHRDLGVLLQEKLGIVEIVATITVNGEEPNKERERLGLPDLEAQAKSNLLDW